MLTIIQLRKRCGSNDETHSAYWGEIGEHVEIRERKLVEAIRGEIRTGRQARGIRTFGVESHGARNSQPEMHFCESQGLSHLRPAASYRTLRSSTLTSKYFEVRA